MCTPAAENVTNTIVGGLIPGLLPKQPGAAAPVPVTPGTQASKTPDTPAMLAAKRKSAGGMGGGTLLTGATGAMPGMDQLGKATLLGQ